MKNRFDKMNWAQVGLAALIVSILMFLVLAPSSRADAAMTPANQGHAGTARLHRTNDARPAFPIHIQEIPHVKGQ
ncbi:MAG: hypothetical protein P8Y54_10620 [Xanthomonadales bacterium]